ncbi:MAG: hypothetical protein HPY85_17455 [Anaerolineae bacterium]|nr:hypothetical protein [Anaerolineae bacterium]
MSFKRFVSRLFDPLAILLLLALLLAALPTAAAAAQSGSSLSGVLTIVYGDSPEGGARTLYFLTIPDGTQALLQFDPARTDYGALRTLAGSEVALQGTFLESAQSDPAGLPLFAVSTFAAAAPDAPNELDAPALAGSYPFISLMCKFADISSEPQPLSYFTGQYANTYPGLDAYWREASYNQFNIAGSTAAGWKTLPNPRSYYLDANGNLLHTLLAQECTALFDAQINFSGYTGINLMFNGQLDAGNHAWGGSAWVCLDGKCSWRMTWEPPWGWGSNGVMAHEMGHSFGLPHSTGHYVVYKNQWDVMSDTWSNCTRLTAAPYGCQGQHTIAHHKDLMGVLGTARKAEVPDGTSATITIERLTNPATSHVQYVKVPIGGSSSFFYTIEVRQNNTASGNDQKLPGSAVILHEVLTTRGDDADVIDIDATASTGDAGAQWVVGETFTDTANNISISVLSAGDSTYTVRVRNNAPLVPPAPQLDAPTDASVLTTEPQFTWQAAEGADSYQVALIDHVSGSSQWQQTISAASACSGTACAYTHASTIADGHYRWQVRGSTDGAYGDWSEAFTFKKAQPIPQAELRSPGVDAVVYGGRPTLKWYPVSSATTYDVELYGLSDELLGTWTKGTGACATYCEHRIPFDLESAYGDYEWRVRARNTDLPLSGEWSALRTFSYTQLARTWQISPADGYSTSDTSPTLQWADMEGATMYLVNFRLPDDTFVANMLVSDATYCDGSTCTWNVDPALATGEYKWHVRAKNGRNFGRWTAYRTINITD